MQPRDFERVASTPADLLIAGGGIYGLAIAREAASRGVRTILIDALDFGSGPSFNHQQIVPGGLPALRRGRLSRARSAIGERRALARLAPWLLRPLPVLVSTHRSAAQSRLILRAIFALDGWIGRKRNVGVEPELHLPAARLVSRAATLRLFPGVRPDGLTGGAQWYDYQVLDHDRLTLAFAAAAQQAGAELATYVEPVSAIREGGRVAGLRVRDGLTGTEANIRVAVVVNAAGAGVNTLLKILGVNRTVAQVETLTLVTTKQASDIALAAPASASASASTSSRDRGMLMLLPWHGRAIIVKTGATSVDDVVADAAHAFPALGLRASDVSVVHRGAVPVGSGSWIGDNRAAAQILDHGGDGAGGAITVTGGALAGARATARRVVALAARQLDRPLREPRRTPPTLPGAGIADHEALAIETARAVGLELPLALIRHLIARYAEQAAEIVKLMASDTRLQAPLQAGKPHVAAEVVFAVRQEMAVRLSDVVIRRLGLGAAERPGLDALRAAAALAAAELQWDDTRMRDEIAAVEAFYGMRGSVTAA